MTSPNDDTATTYDMSGYTICVTTPLDADEESAMRAYLSMLRKAQDRKRGIVDLDRGAS